MAEQGVLDTSVVIDLDVVDADTLPEQIAITAITLAELAAGPHATNDPLERARRQERLVRIAGTYDPLPFDSHAAHAYGQLYAATLAKGRQPRSRFADLAIAAIAMTAGVPLYTRNPDDFEGLQPFVTVVPI